MSVTVALSESVAGGTVTRTPSREEVRTIVSENSESASATMYCPACWGAGELYRIPARADGDPHSCSSCSPLAEDWEPYPCTRCTGTGLVPAVPRASAGGNG
jgi:DnaJ-class molecular chaperone